MMNPYSVLGILPGASERDIKAAFRKKIKELHPDTRRITSHEKGIIDVHQVIEAYELLNNPERRREFEVSFRPTSSGGTFHYRRWLQERSDNLSKAKLIFYDVLRERGEEALALYDEMSQKRSFQLEKLLGREDFMDCAFMLAIECESQKNYEQAVRFYLRICQLENERSYFRHFFIEVENHLLHLLTVKITGQLSAYSLIHLLEELQFYPLSQKSKSLLLLKQAQLYHQLGQSVFATICLYRAKELSPHGKKIAFWEKLLNQSIKNFSVS